MIITAPVTDYIRASILTTNGDMVLRGAAIPGRLASGAADLFLKAQGAGVIPVWETIALSDTGVHIGNAVRNTAGAQVITGVGFTSSIVIFFAVDGSGGQENLSNGADDGTVHNCVYYHSDGTAVSLSSTHSIHIEQGGGNSIIGLVSAIGGDGFTLTWTLAGVQATKFVYICLP